VPQEPADRTALAQASDEDRHWTSVHASRNERFDLISVLACCLSCMHADRCKTTDRSTPSEICSAGTGILSRVHFFLRLLKSGTSRFCATTRALSRTHGMLWLEHDQHQPKTHRQEIKSGASLLSWSGLVSPRH
jgi:hypothetical protein